MASNREWKKRIKEDFRYMVHITEERHIRTHVTREQLVLFEKLLPILLDADVINVKQFLNHGFDMKDLERHYAPEAAEIAMRLDEWKTYDETERGVRKVLSWWFGGLGCNEEVFAKKAARDIWNAWRVYRGLLPEEFSDELVLPPKGRSIPIYVD
jgi:hypothetical protein